MVDTDSSFQINSQLTQALDLLQAQLEAPADLPLSIPEDGIGDLQSLEQLAPHVLGRAAYLDAPHALAHMDPPTPWITWVTALWNARLNQNLLHPMTAPFALEAEERVISWLLPFFGMTGGHMCAGSTIANLAAIWAARDAGGVSRVVTSEAAHISVEKAATILGLGFERIPVDGEQKLNFNQLSDLSDACLVLTAGTTAAGAIDPLDLVGQAAWTHVDAAWAGPLRLTSHANLLDGIEKADSIAISAHKWLYQPKDSALVLFRDVEKAHAAISSGSSYLVQPNVGVQGSRGAAAVSLLATLLAWGKAGTARRIERNLQLSEELARKVTEEDRLLLWNAPAVGVTVFRPTSTTVESVISKIPDGMFSTCSIDTMQWVRSVAVNPLADFDLIWETLQKALRSGG